MAALLFGINRGALNTTTGNQTFTDSNFGGESPKAARFYVTSATANNTLTNHKRWGIGYADGTTQACMYGFAENGAATTQAERSGLQTRCIALTDTSDSTLDFEASFVSFGTNSVTINITNAPTSAYILTVEFFGGADLQAHVATPTLNATVNGTVTVTPGFESDIILMDYNDDDLDGVTNNIYSRMSRGACINDGSLTQMCCEIESIDNSPAGDVQGHFNSSRIAYSVGGAEEVEVTSITTTTYVLTSRLSGIDEKCICLALNIGTANVALAKASTPTTISTQTLTLGWEPGYAFFHLSTFNTSTEEDTDITSASAGAIGFGAITANDEFSYSVTDENGAGTTVTRSYTNINALTVYDDAAPTNGIKYSSAPAITATGIDLVYSNVDPSARSFWYLAIEKGTVVGGAANPWYYYANQ